MLSLEQYFLDNKKGQLKLIERVRNPDRFTPSVSLNLWFCEVTFGVYNVVNSKKDEGKNNFSLCGLLDEYSTDTYNSRFFDYGLHHISYVLLSDNEPLIQRYAKLRYQKGKNAELSMDEMVLEGESAIWCNTVQFFMSNDNVGVERNLNIIETKTSHMGSKKSMGFNERRL